MESLSKKALFRTVVFGMLMSSGYQEVTAQETSYNYEGIKILPLTSQIANVIKNAATQDAALDRLCGQGGIMRGSGFNAGKTCLLQDFARLAHLSCANYQKGKDSFSDSKCAKNIDKVLREQGKMTASFYLEDAVGKNYPNTVTIVCDTTPGYRQKLPDALKLIAGLCPKPTAPERPVTPLPVDNLAFAKFDDSSDLASARLPRTQQVNISEADLASARLPAPVEFSTMIQSALRDLPNRAEIESLYESQLPLFENIQALEKKDRLLEAQGIPKSAPARNILLKQQADLTNQYLQVNTQLREIKINLGQEKSQLLRKELLEVAKKQSEAIRELAKISGKVKD